MLDACLCMCVVMAGGCSGLIHVHANGGWVHWAHAHACALRWWVGASYGVHADSKGHT